MQLKRLITRGLLAATTAALAFGVSAQNKPIEINMWMGLTG